MTAKNTYETLKTSVGEEKTELDRLIQLNKLGKAEYSDVKSKEEEYQSAQNDTLDALSSYTKLLYSFDRLTCGAVTLLLKGEDIPAAAGNQADSYFAGREDGVYYYIESKVEDNIFVFGLTVPDNFEPKITDYELWYEDTKIGEKTAVNKQLLHLTLDFGEAENMTVRLYDGDKFVADCRIDPAVTTGRLNIKKQ